MMPNIWDYLVHQAQTNDFFTGAALGGATLACLNYARRGTLRLGRALVRRLTVSATVHSEDDLYVPLSRWLSQYRFDAFAQQYRIRTPARSDTTYYGGGGTPPRGDTTAADAVFGPTYGAYTFRYRRKWLRVTVSKEGEAAGQGTSRSAQTREFLTITYLGLSRTLLTHIVEQALEAANLERATALPCFYASMHGWTTGGSMRRIATATCPVVLDGDLLDDVENDVEQFLGARDWYDARGIPWRRGYLLYGPPGTGKTSLCRHLARRFGLNIYAVDASGYMGELGPMLKQVPARSLVLFEDIDCHDISKRVPREGAKAGVSSSGVALMQMNIGTLLNAIDGINPAEEMLIVMTSNNPDVLDPALVRPGRIDRKIHLGLCTRDHATKLLLKFFPDLVAGDVARFRAAVPDNRHSPADLQEIFITAGDFAAVMARVRAGAAAGPLPTLEHSGRPMTLRECVEAEGG